MGNLYMHTINGRPALYYPGEQIVFFNKWSRVKHSEIFVDSLDTIKRQQKASTAWREKRGYTPSFDDKYGYIRVWDDR